MNTITSKLLDRCLEYSDNMRLSSNNYGNFIKALVHTMKAELPVEILDQETNSIIKAQLKYFSITYMEGREGILDTLNIEYVEVGQEELKTLKFDKIGKADIIRDKKSSSRSFYRYYINPSENNGYRLTFNRRISKVK